MPFSNFLCHPRYCKSISKSVNVNLRISCRKFTTVLGKQLSNKHLKRRVTVKKVLEDEFSDKVQKDEIPAKQCYCEICLKIIHKIVLWRMEKDIVCIKS